MKVRFLNLGDALSGALSVASDIGIETSLVWSDNAYALVLLADCNAASAKDTFVVIANQMNSRAI
jgi:hypothetical protein